MKKFTVVVNEKGELVAAQPGSSDRRNQEAGWRPDRGRRCMSSIFPMMSHPSPTLAISREL